MGGRAHKRTRAPSGQADGQTSERMGGRADARTGAGTLGRRANGGGQWADGQISGRGQAGAQTGG